MSVEERCHHLEASHSTLLKKMADAGRGRFYAVTDPSALEKILVREIGTP